MDRIINGISAFNFQKNIDPEINENCSPNLHLESSAAKDFNPIVMADPLYKSNDLNTFVDVRNSTQNKMDGIDPLSSNRSELSGVEVNSELKYADPCCSRNTPMLNSRRPPSRACKESNILHKTNRRSIMEPKRMASKSRELRPAEIKKIYLNKKIVNFHSSKLETIFEEPSNVKSGGDDSGLQMIGTRKVKRSISCCDGLNVNKTLIKQRRLKIKKTFGKRFALKKILLEDFMKQLNKNFQDDSEMIGSEEVVQHSRTDHIFPPLEPLEAVTLQSHSSKDIGKLNVEVDIYKELL